VKTVMLAEYRGLTVQQLSDFRKQLKAVSAEYKIVKKPAGQAGHRKLRAQGARR